MLIALFGTFGAALAATYVVYVLVYSEIAANLRAKIETGLLEQYLGKRVGGFFRKASTCPKCASFWANLAMWPFILVTGHVPLLYAVVGVLAGAYLTGFVFLPSLQSGNVKG